MSIPEPLIFGQRIANVEYVFRPGAYVIIQHAERVAIVRTTGGYCLPGGGQEPEETLEATAVRECREEVGLSVRIVRCIGTADQLAYGEKEEQYFHKLCTFFLAELVTEERSESEADHELVWMTVDEARDVLMHESERWALAQSRAT